MGGFSDLIIPNELIFSLTFMSFVFFFVFVTCRHRRTIPKLTINVEIFAGIVFGL